MPKVSHSNKATTSRAAFSQSQSLTQNGTEHSVKSQRSIENVDQLVNNCVRYIIYRAGNNLPIRKPDLQKNVLSNIGRQFDSIIKLVTDVLKNVYNYDLYLIDGPSSSKSYLISNSLPYMRGTFDKNEDETAPSDAHKILVMLVLTHVFMSNTSITEASIFSFLRSMNVEPDTLHELFGNVKEFVTVTMVKQKYLSTLVQENTSKTTYIWGPRAEHEISKHELLKFVCKIYKDRLPKSWTDQFNKANEQFGMELNGEEMEIEDDSS